MTIELVQNGSHLIPVVQGLAYSGSRHWNYIVGPGRPGASAATGLDAGVVAVRARPARPELHPQRALTFLFYDDTRVSSARYQITQETCLHLKFDLWGQLATETCGGTRSPRRKLRARARGRGRATAAHRPVRRSLETSLPPA